MFEFLSSVLPDSWTGETAERVPEAHAAAAPEAHATALAPEAAPAPIPAKDGAPPDPDKVRAVSSRLFQKMDGLFQDEKGVLAELGKLSPAELAAVKAQYKDQEHGRDLDADVMGAMDRDGQKAEAQALLAGNDPARKINAAAAALKGATEDGLFGSGTPFHRNAAVVPDFPVQLDRRVQRPQAVVPIRGRDGRSQLRQEFRCQRLQPPYAGRPGGPSDPGQWRDRD